VAPIQPPSDGREVLVYSPEVDSGENIKTGHHEWRNNEWVVKEWNYMISVTHWCNLPEPPQL